MAEIGGYWGGGMNVPGQTLSLWRRMGAPLSDRSWHGSADLRLDPGARPHRKCLTHPLLLRPRMCALWICVQMSQRPVACLAMELRHALETSGRTTSVLATHGPDPPPRPALPERAVVVTWAAGGWAVGGLLAVAAAVVLGDSRTDLVAVLPTLPIVLSLLGWRGAKRWQAVGC